MLVAAFAMSAVAASAASAAAPEFRHKGGEVVKRKFKSTTGVAKLDAAGTVVTCASSSTAAGAEIEKGNAAKEQKNVKGVVVTFKKCESENSKEKCKVHSKGKVEEIKTESLSGELGKVAKAEAADERGLDLKPTTGKIFVTLEGTCLPISPSPVEGSVIGEPTKKEEVKGKLVFATSGGKQAIQKFEGGVKDTLEVFKIAEATEETTATNTFEEAVEVT
jgi:Fe-S cluster biogenesis protein NfuA